MTRRIGILEKAQPRGDAVLKAGMRLVAQFLIIKGRKKNPGSRKMRKNNSTLHPYLQKNGQPPVPTSNYSSKGIVAPPKPSNSRKAKREKGGINYSKLDRKNSWLNKYAHEIEDLKDVALSGSFEQMEKAVRSREKPKM